MKKVLLATTAIATAAALSAAPATAGDLNMSMFTIFTASLGDSDSSSWDALNRDHDFAMNSEIHFNPMITADNGLTFGAHVELEADSSDNDEGPAGSAPGNVDESSLYISGSFGKIELGDNDGAADVYGVNGSYVGVNYGGISNPTGTVLSALRTGDAHSDVNLHMDGGDDTKITYFTPRFSGFQAAVSYTPWGGSEENIGIGLNYKADFDGVGVNVGVSYADGENSSGDDEDGWMAGLMISYAGFSIAGGYVDEEDDDGSENEIYNVGVGYANGPYSVALAAIWSENDDAGTIDELEEYSLSLTYNVASGLSVFATGLIGETDEAGSSNDYNMITVGTKASF